MSRTGDDTPTVEGAFIRIRALGHAVAYAGVRVQEGTTAAETIELVATKLLDALGVEDESESDSVT